MGLFNGFYTSASGLNSNSHAINVAGNNIANVNTAGFKSSRASFETQISQLLRSGSAPNGDLGGTNPAQLGLGSRVSGISRDFTDGSLQLTGVNTDMAIEGKGFFVLNVEGEQRFTRNGAFQINRDTLLTSADGGLLQGYGVDSDFNVVPGPLGNLAIPLGTLTLAEATSEVKFSGNLNSAGTPATQGTNITTDQLFSDALGTTSATGTTALTSLYNAGGTQLFSTGDIVHFTNMMLDGTVIPDKTFEVGGANTTESDSFGTTLGDLTEFMETILGIDTSVGSAGVSINNGVVEIEGNTGFLNDLSILNSGVYVNAATGLNPFAFTKNQEADGESVRTTFNVFDSLGNAKSVDLTMVMEEKSNTGTDWRFYVRSEDDSDLDTIVGNGTITFDTTGKSIAATGTTITIDHEETGADTPQTIELTLDDPNIGLSALASTTSQIAAQSQDGSPIGTLDDFIVQSDGTIVGQFSNGLLRSLGQVALATFVNEQGLVETSANQFASTPSSGNAAVVAPGTGSAGGIVGQALELSNVEISNEFIHLVTASTGFSANSRVFTTSDRLLQELLAAIR